MNFAEWTEKQNRLKEPELTFGEWTEKNRGYTPGGSFGAERDTLSRSGGRSAAADSSDPDEKTPAYSLVKGVAGGVQKGLTDLAQTGGNAAALWEDVNYVPMEILSGRKIGELSDKGPFNRWNDSIHREADRVEDYYAENIAAGGVGAELLDKTVSKAISFLPQALYTGLTGGAAAVPELAKAAGGSLPGIAGDIQSVAEKVAGAPQYWLSAAGTAGERYQEAKEKTPASSAGGWLQNVAQSVGEGLYKEAIGSSDEVPEWLSALTEIAYEMYEERREKKEEGSVLNSTLNGLMKLLWR